MRIFLFLLLQIVLVDISLAQGDLQIDTGRINDANYKIIFPANWDGKLVMFAHGYEFMGTKPRQSQSPGFVKQMQPFLERGFAIAASDYRLQGFALPQAVEDTEALREYFFDKYGKPEITLMVGTSMGGGVTLATMENFSKNYQGALALCPFSSRPYVQIRKEFDMYAVFNALFPNVTPSLSDLMDEDAPYPEISPGVVGPKIQAIKAALAEDTILAAQFAKQFDLKVIDIPMALVFNENVLRDIARKAGGNPFDNTNTVYSGFPNDYELNKIVERLPATVEEDDIFGKYDRTGDIGKPVVLMHTVYDQLIPPQFGVTNFDNMVHQKNREDLLTVKFTDGQGHCRFKPEQIGKAFDELQEWVKNGKKPAPGAIE